MRPWPLIGRDEELVLARRALARAGTTALVLTGEAGVGKTRLAHEIAEGAAENGKAVLRAVATAQTLPIPLGVIAPLLPEDTPGDETGDPLSALARVHRALRTGADLVLIDDAPYLDDLAVGTVQQLVHEGDGSPRVLLTARTEDVPDWLAELARDDHVEHVRLQPLGTGDVDAVLSAVLAGDIDEKTRSMLRSHSRGNALLLRRLVVDGIETGALSQRADTWTWEGRLDSADLWSVIEARINWMSPAERDALDAIAVGEPLPLGILEDVVDPGCLTGLDAHALIEVDAIHRVRVGHPLIGAVLRDRMTTLGARGLKKRLAEAFVRAGTPQGTDLVRVAQWQLEADCVDPALVTSASEYALRLDPDLAERFARAVAEPGSPTGPRHTLARALYEQARLAEARDAYAEAMERAVGSEDQIAAMMGLALTAFWGEANPARAHAVLDRLAELHPELVDRVGGTRAAMHLFAGEPSEALETTSTMDESDPAVLLLAAIVAVTALALLGRPREAVDLAERAGVLDPEPDADLIDPTTVPTFAFAQLLWEYAFALRWSGRIDAAVEITGERLARAAAGATSHPYALTLTQATAGGALLAAGDVEAARSLLRVAADGMLKWDREGTGVSCLADLARAEALAGDLPAARRALEQAATHRPDAVHLFDASLGRARAVVAALDGDLPAAREEALTGAALARAYEQPVLEAACLHLLVRFGAPDAAVDRLTGLAASVRAPLVDAFAEHAAAATAADPAGLESAADSFADAGALMLAAHTAAQAAHAWHHAGRDTDARRSAHRCTAWAARCPGAPKPSLAIAPSPLTARERDIASLAAKGMSNQEIADRFVISVRTVESHLEHVYRKLGIGGRDDLPAMAIW